MENVYYCHECEQIYSTVSDYFYSEKFNCSRCCKTICFGCVYKSKYELCAQLDDSTKYIQKCYDCEWKEELDKMNKRKMKKLYKKIKKEIKKILLENS